MGINELLPRYHKAHRHNPTCKVVRTIVVDGHESAWLELRGTLEVPTLVGPEFHRYRTHAFWCECDFTEGVGWSLHASGPVSLVRTPCHDREVALYKRVLELREECFARFRLDPSDSALSVLRIMLEEVILYLVERARAGEFVGADPDGYDGGYFDLRYITAITERPLEEVHNAVRALERERKLGLSGQNIVSYTRVLRDRALARA